MKKIYLLVFGMVIAVFFSSVLYINSNEKVLNTLKQPFFVFAQGDDESKELESEKKGSTFIGKGATSIQWRVTKTGKEEEIEVEYEIKDNTSTEFCIKVKDKSYADNKTAEGKNISLIPITILNGTLNIDKESIDFSGEELEIEECFTVEYDNLTEDLSFKIGWNSILIDASADSLATAYGSNKNACRSGNKCHVAYEASGSDWWYGNATYDVATDSCLDDWTIKELLIGTVSQLSIYCLPNGSLITSGIVSSDLDMFQSEDSGASWVGPITVEDDVGIYGGPYGSDVDSNNVVHWCLITSGTDDDLHYVNSSALDEGREISGDNTDHCDLAVDINNNVFILVSTETTPDDIEIMSSLDGYGSRNQVDDNADSVSATIGEGVSLVIQDNGSIHTSAIMASNLHYCIGNVANWDGGTSAYACQEIDGTDSSNPDIAVSDAGDVFILYSAAPTDNDDIFLANNTAGGAFSAPRTNVVPEASSGLPSILDSLFILDNRLSNVLNFIYTTTSDLRYLNFSIRPAPVFFLNITNPLESNILLTDSDTNETIGFQVFKDGVEQTSGVDILNITIDGVGATIRSTSSVESGDVPTFVNAGSIVYDAGGDDVTPTPPAHIENDILIAAASHSNDVEMDTVTSGWTRFGSEITNAGSSAWFWKRATDSGTAGPFIDTGGSAGNMFGISYAIRGAITTGTPFEDATSATDQFRGTSADTSTIDTTGDNRLVMAFAGIGDNVALSNEPTAGWDEEDSQSNVNGVVFYVQSKEEASATQISAAVICSWTGLEEWGSMTTAFIPALIGEIQEFNYNGSDWVANITTPTLVDGLYDLFINATVQGKVANDTEVNSVQYGIPPPSFLNNKTNASATSPKNGTTVQLNLTITDPINIDAYILAHNDTVSSCAGTLDCSQYVAEAACGNCSQCNWTSDPPINWEHIDNITQLIPSDNNMYSVDLPGGIAEGDIVIAVLTSDFDAGELVINTLGYTNISVAAADVPVGLIAYKIMGNPPDSEVNVTKFSSTARDMGVILDIWRGVNTTDPIDTSPSTTATGSSANPDCPSYVTTTDNALVFCVGQMDDDIATVSVVPTGFTNLTYFSGSLDVGESNTAAISSRINASAGTTNPTAYTFSLSDAWEATTFALRLASGGGASCGEIAGGGACSQCSPLSECSNCSQAGCSIKQAGFFTNESVIDITAETPITAIFNYSIINFPVEGGIFGWQVWANSTNGNVNVSQIYTLVVQGPAPEDTCIPTVGQSWIIEDNCTKSQFSFSNPNYPVNIKDGSLTLKDASNLTAKYINISHNKYVAFNKSANSKYNRTGNP